MSIISADVMSALLFEDERSFSNCNRLFYGINIWQGALTQLSRVSNTAPCLVPWTVH